MHQILVDLLVVKVMLQVLFPSTERICIEASGVAKLTDDSNLTGFITQHI